MKIALTGHTNLEKCYGYEINKEGEVYSKDAFELCYNEIYNALIEVCNLNGLKFDDLTLVSGMARGADEVFAEIAYRNNLKLILSIPHSISWHKNRANTRKFGKDIVRSQAIEYDKYLNYEKAEIYEIKKNYNNETFIYANFARNKHMVDICDLLISFKKYDSTGTDHCIKEGKKQNKYFGNTGEINLKNEFEI